MNDDGFQIKGDDGASVFVSAYREEHKSVWLSVFIRNANVSVVLSQKQAQELIAALQQVTA